VAWNITLMTCIKCTNISKRVFSLGVLTMRPLKTCMKWWLTLNSCLVGSYERQAGRCKRFVHSYLSVSVHVHWDRPPSHIAQVAHKTHWRHVSRDLYMHVSVNRLDPVWWFWEPVITCSVCWPIRREYKCLAGSGAGMSRIDSLAHKSLVYC